jgi:uncharacterized protein YuzE
MEGEKEKRQSSSRQWLREKNKIKIEYDKEVDALYVHLQEKYVARTVQIEEGLNLDLDEEGKLIGLEVLDATQRYSLADIFNISTENQILEKEPEKVSPSADL